MKVRITVELLDDQDQVLKKAVGTNQDALLSEPFAGAGKDHPMTPAKWVGEIAEAVALSMDFDVDKFLKSRVEVEQL